MILFFLSSGLFLGWSLGANDAANVFGTAVGTKMLRFRTAALTCSIFVVLGAVIGGAGASHTLGKLGSVNAIAGAFMVAFSAAFTVFWMTRLRVPVSTSQAIVGAIVGWNLFSGSLTDLNSLSKIVTTWVVCPILAAALAALLFTIIKKFYSKVKIHMLRLDMHLRLGLLLVGAFGSYSLGANNIANVMGVFVPVSPFQDFDVFGLFVLSGTQQLFLIGSLAIAVGVYTYSHKVMETVGSGLFRLSPEAALVVVLTNAFILFLFSSEGLESWLLSHGLPTIPLVPVSSSQAVIGSVLGIGLLKGGNGLNFGVLGGIASGWVTTPVISGLLTFIALFFLQNVFNQEVSRKTTYVISDPVIEYLATKDIPATELAKLRGESFANQSRMQSALRTGTALTSEEISLVIRASESEHFFIDPVIIANKIDTEWLTRKQVDALRQLSGMSFTHEWQLIDALNDVSDAWKLKTHDKTNKKFNREARAKRQYVFDAFRTRAELAGD